MGIFGYNISHYSENSLFNTFQLYIVISNACIVGFMFIGAIYLQFCINYSKNNNSNESKV